MTFSVDDNDRFWKEDQQRGWFRFPNPLRYMLLLILLIVLIVGVWYLLPSSPSSNSVELPLIRADSTPFKIKAEDQEIPGIQHQDKLVYGRIRNDGNEPPVEHILPDPETPLANLKEPKATIKMVDQYTPEDVNPEKSEEATAVEKATVPLETPSSPLTSIETLIEEATPPQNAVATEKPSLPKKGVVLIQLGSLKSHDLAKEEWIRLSKKHKDVLGGFDPIIQKVDLGEDKGIFYRLRAQIKDGCSSLKERGVNCVVIQP